MDEQQNVNKVDKFYMNKAIAISKKGMGKVSPNPMVGCLVVKNDRVLSSGYHKIYGGPHAEVEALSKIKPSDCKGSILYVTFEPCHHYGKTPPCTKLISQYPFKKIVIGAKDINPLVSGKGIRYLKRNGFNITFPVEEKKIIKLNEAYVKYTKSCTPFVTLKAAMSLDGKIAASTGHSKWITNEGSRKDAHRLRYFNDAIMIGVGTAIADNPKLDCRMYKKDKVPIRIVVDPNGRTPLASNIINDAKDIRTIIVVKKSIPKKTLDIFKGKGVEIIELSIKKGIFDLETLLKELGKKGIASVLIEGGSKLLGTALEQKVADKMYLYIAPKVIGTDGIEVFYTNGVKKVTDSFKFEILSVKKIGTDIRLMASILSNKC